MSEDLTGRRLGHYRIDGVIGRGGMSVLYRATDMRLGRKVALKVIGDQLAADPEFRERFVDEARNTSAVDHAHVVPLYDFDEVDGQFYIAMRYVEGSDLASLIKDGPLGAQRTLALLGQVADALDALHGHGLVHLDVKPANVLVTQKESLGGGEHVYLADFGLTRRGATGHRTRSGDFLGSPTYAAPEHLRGEPVDPRTDQYSLCCVLFACLAGRPPFIGTVPEVIAGHLGTAPPAITPLVLLPPGIDDVVSRGMSKDIRRRYGSCRELLSAARAALTVPASPARRAPAPPPAKARSTDRPADSASGPSRPPSSPAAPNHGARPGWQPSRQAQQREHPSHAAHPSQTTQGAQSYRSGSAQPPMRIRDPLPMQSASFAKVSGGPARWLVPALLVAAVVAGVVFLLVIVLSDGGSGDGQHDTPRTGPVTSAPYTSPSRTAPQTGPTNPGHDQLPTAVPTVRR